MRNRTRHSFKMTVDGAELGQDECGDGQPPARPVRTTSHLASSSARNMQQAHLATGPLAAPTTSASRRQQQQQQQQRRRQLNAQSGSKDLIVRMLAEIFQVRQDESGQARWQQVSTSLVPISLYSRTTSKWLEYLLEASCSMRQLDDPSSAMSPDSRDFLLQLQQFHQHQQQQQHASGRPTYSGQPNLGPRWRHQSHAHQSQAQQQQQQQQDSIVFQVVGHDFVEGQCRKILNVKIRQPGVRLGQASDYFVYWKELAPSAPAPAPPPLPGAQHPHPHQHHRLYHQQFSASSFADSTMSYLATPIKSAHMLNGPAGQLRLGPGGVHLQHGFHHSGSSNNNHNHNHNQQQQPTWGLNFASINDAKLFYDICSLNLVNLDFNSDYLGQLTALPCDRKRAELGAGPSAPPAARWPAQAHMLKTAGQQRLVSSRLVSRQSPAQELKRHAVRQSSGGGGGGDGRCPSCRHAFEATSDAKQRQSAAASKLAGQHQHQHQHQQEERDEAPGAGAPTTHSGSCPVHGHRAALRARSRSTSRRTLAPTEAASEAAGSVRARSFSTPASPELLAAAAAADECPVHRRSARRNQRQEQQPGTHTQSECQRERDVCSPTARGWQPEKPARGLLRTSYPDTANCGVGGGPRAQRAQQAGRPPVPQHQASVASSERAAKRDPRAARHMEPLHNSDNLGATSGGALAAAAAASERPARARRPIINGSGASGASGDNHRSLLQQIQAADETFDADARRDARLARARYANSRNMKEFLSLDAGGLHLTPIGAGGGGAGAGASSMQRGQPSARQAAAAAAAATTTAQRRPQGQSADWPAGSAQSKSIDKSGRPCAAPDASPSAAGDARASAQSVRSPTQYGLYESDYYDDEAGAGCGQDELEELDGAEPTLDRAAHFGNSTQNYADVSCVHHHEHQHQQLGERTHPSTQAQYLISQHPHQHLGGQQPGGQFQLLQRLRDRSGDYATATLRPVAGYDRTLARSQLRSRQRSKSQPPASEASCPEAQGAFHLTKSMENIEKLIREVQNELRALKRQPLGTANIHMRSPCQQANQANGREEAKRARARAQPSQEHAETEAGAGPGPARADALEAGGGARQQGAGQRAKVAQEQSEPNHSGERPDAPDATGSGANASQKVSLSSATRRAGQFKCVGAIRKAGFLSVKKWILKRRQSIELARKQGWKRYWVCLRGTALLFHSVIDAKEPGGGGGGGQDADQEPDNRTDLLSWIRANCAGQLNMLTELLRSEWAALGAGALDDPSADTNAKGNASAQQSSETFLGRMSKCHIEREPRHLIIIDGAIAQPIPEHPRRDFVFCLSTTFGDAYLFQASCQLESDNWTAAIHNACAASIARDLVRDEAVKLFETKIRHFELEAEKKLFLRQRLESRLTSMSSMCQQSHAPGRHLATLDQILTGGNKSCPTQAEDKTPTSKRTTTMRSLLGQLSQQLLALDTYVEQLHCEVYQLRCYLSSCGHLSTFYQQTSREPRAPGAKQQSASSATNNHQHLSDLPNPKSLLMHVSKPTKLLLIKLGVFTVSSFHAYIHARQESANSILQAVQEQQQQQQQQQQPSHDQASCAALPALELRIRSRSISETLIGRESCERALEAKLASDTENLIQMANLKTVPIMLSRALLVSIRARHQHQHQHQQQRQQQTGSPADEGSPRDDLLNCVASDDRCTVESRGEFVLLSLKLNSSSTSASIIKQALKIIAPASGESEFLHYYLRLAVADACAAGPGHAHTRSGARTGTPGPAGDALLFVAVKRDETLDDWSNFEHLELLEKVVFRVELARSRLDELDGDSGSSAPFGVSVEGQLITDDEHQEESLLSVFCSYIEWGSAADKAGLQDEDELLALNGVALADLDLMFVECLLAEASRLRLVVRSNRLEGPAGARKLDRANWRSLDDSDDPGGAGTEREHAGGGGNGGLAAPQRGSNLTGAGSQVISDEYLTSLVCPPPPARSSAFLRTDTSLLRQKSDLGAQARPGATGGSEFSVPALGGGGGGGGAVLGRAVAATGTTKTNAEGPNFGLCKSSSQHRMDSTLASGPQQCEGQPLQARPKQQPRSRPAIVSSSDLARQLLQRSERLTKLLNAEAHTSDLDALLSTSHLQVDASAGASINNSESSQGKDKEINNNNNNNNIFSSNMSENDRQPEVTTSDNKATSSRAPLEAGAQNHVERLRKCILELVETEYAYIRHLETISEHYMAPLGESGFLDIGDLRAFNETVLALLRFQHAFFGRLMDGVFVDCKLDFASGLHQSVSRDDFERFNRVVQHIESVRALDQLEPLIGSLARTFAAEADKFRVYAAYCAAYARLQRILHPKSSASRALATQSAPAVTSAPLGLNTFLASALGAHLLAPACGRGGGGGAGGAEHQLRKLAEFLGSLDSSSSSASFSLPRSSSPEQRAAQQQLQQQQQQQQRAPLASARKLSAGASSSSAASGADAADASGSYLKSVHQQNFESYLIKPIQRIVKYPMLLNSISLAAAAATDGAPSGEGRPPQEPGASHRDDLQSAIKRMETVINHVNDAQRVLDEYGLMFGHIERQFFVQQSLDLHTNRSSAHYATLFGPHQPPITLNIAQLLYFGQVDWLNLAEFAAPASAKKAAGSKSEAHAHQQQQQQQGNQQLTCLLFVFESCVVFICKGPAGKTNRRKLPLRSIHNAQTSRVLPWSTSAGQPSAAGASGEGATGSGSGSGGDQAGAIVRYQTLIPVSEVQVRSVSDAAGAGYKWELFQCSSSNSNSSLLTACKLSGPKQQQQQHHHHHHHQQQQQQQQLQLKHQHQHQQQQHPEGLRRGSGNSGKVYLLSSGTSDERSAFLRKIRLTIRESVRNMSLPAASSKSLSSNKSPSERCPEKKLSTSSASSVASNTNTHTNTHTTNATSNAAGAHTNNTRNSSASLSPPESSCEPELVAAGTGAEGRKRDNGHDGEPTMANAAGKCEPYHPRKQQVQHETSIEVNT